MDDFSPHFLKQSLCEWCARLCNVLTPVVIEGFKHILDEAVRLCKQNDEPTKYLLTYQNLLTRVPKWNNQIIEKEKDRIIKRSACGYLGELITCVHVVQLKLLTAMRVGQKQKQIKINIPKVETFIHQCYIHAARQLFKNVYLFEQGIAPLQMQKNMHEIEYIVRESIINAIRENIPIEELIRAYLDETLEEEIIEEVQEQIIEKPLATTTPTPAPAPAVSAPMPMVLDIAPPPPPVEEEQQQPLPVQASFSGVDSFDNQLMIKKPTTASFATATEPVLEEVTFPELELMPDEAF